MATTGDETLADEQRRRITAGGAAAAAAILTFAGGVLAQVTYSGLPQVFLIDALREHLGPPSSKLGLKAEQVLWFDHHAGSLILLGIVQALATGAIGFTLMHLYRSTKARRPELSPRIVQAAIAGAALLAAAWILRPAGQTIAASSFAGSTHQTAVAARAALQSSAFVTSEWLQQLGNFALGIPFVLISLNAMRVGLLTRFTGVLGIIAGVVVVVPQIGSSLPIIQMFWLAAISVLFFGRWPKGMPPAWVTGEAQPWPTQQQLREARLESQGRTPRDDEAPRRTGRRARPEPPETPAPAMPERRPHPSSKKKKRKRR